jgi:UDP-4-amino-4,6-dideoxy-N-acetyl-beta-L-altrosamine transaminase
MIPYGKQIISQDDIDAVVNILRSPLITQGPAVKAFEDAVAGYCGAKYAAAVNSGTAALHIACLALGIGAGDTVWVSSVSFVASSNCALYCGADVDFVDLEYGTGNMDMDRLEAKLESARIRPKAVIVVHLAGMPADLEKLHELSKKYGFKIIEDACHALGAAYRGEKIGSCRYSDITVFSFHPVKAITTGEGGMAVTNDAELHRRMKLFGTHGITRDAGFMEGETDGGWVYQQLELGYNYRMPDINAALGISQLKNLDEWIRIRNEYADFYFDRLKDIEHIELPGICDDRLCAYHLFVIKVKHDRRRYVYDSLREAGIGANVHYIPIYHQPYYRRTGRYKPLEMTEKYYSRILTIPLCPALKQKDLDYVAEELKRICSKI